MTTKLLLLAVAAICSLLPSQSFAFTVSRVLSSHRKTALSRWLGNPLSQHQISLENTMRMSMTAKREDSVLESPSMDSLDGPQPLPDDVAQILKGAPVGDNDIVYSRAIKQTLLWVFAATSFGGALWLYAGEETGAEFFAGYLVEQSLSVDNLFVFLLLFEYFKVPLKLQNRVLNWGIYGAMVMRAVMIGLGAVALKNFHAILLVFAGILVYSSFQVLWPTEEEDDDEDLSDNKIVQFAHRLIESTDQFDGDRFFTVMDGVRKATPLFICLIAVEISDVVFAVDSIPAVFGVTEDPLVVFSSNIFAILGLRSLYTILSKAAADLKYLEPAVAVVLGFIGSKMVAEYFGYVVPTEQALIVVASLLGLGVGASIVERRKERNEIAVAEEEA